MSRIKEKEVVELIGALNKCRTKETFVKAYDKINSILDNVGITEWGVATIQKLNYYKANLYQEYAEKMLNYQMFPVNFTGEQLKKIREKHEV